MGIMDTIMDGATGRWYKFDKPGDTVTGTIAGISEQQVREYGTNKPMTWDNGDPQLQVLITVTTTAREDADDDGNRTVRVKGWGVQRNALREACQKAGKVPELGDRFTATFVREERKSAGGFAAKVYEYVLVPQPQAPPVDDWRAVDVSAKDDVPW